MSTAKPAQTLRQQDRRDQAGTGAATGRLHAHKHGAPRATGRRRTATSAAWSPSPLVSPAPRGTACLRRALAVGRAPSRSTVGRWWFRGGTLVGFAPVRGSSPRSPGRRLHAARVRDAVASFTCGVRTGQSQTEGRLQPVTGSRSARPDARESKRLPHQPRSRLTPVLWCARKLARSFPLRAHRITCTPRCSVRRRGVPFTVTGARAGRASRCRRPIATPRSLARRTMAHSLGRGGCASCVAPSLGALFADANHTHALCANRPVSSGLTVSLCGAPVRPADTCPRALRAFVWFPQLPTHLPPSLVVRGGTGCVLCVWGWGGGCLAPHHIHLL